jgi:K+-transporting ATPase ATPase C chain
MFRPALVLTLVFTALTGLAYPLAMTGLAQLLFPSQANARGVGAVGQTFAGPALFHGRPSATTPPYNAESSTGSNLGPTNPAFLDGVKARVSEVRAANVQQAGPVPADLVTASGSGLDPHISVAAARYQLPRVQAASGRSAAELSALIDAHTEGRWLGIFGEPRVNVVALNTALLRPAPAKEIIESTR